MKLIPSNEAINIVEYGLLSLRQTTQGIRKSLGQDIRKDKIRESEKKRLDVQQFDAVQKKDAEKIVEAKQSNNFIKGGINNIMRGAKSIFQGLLSAAGWILLDYLVQKLPEIIVIVNKVTRIVQKLWDAVKQTWNNIQTTFKEIGDVFRQLASNIKNWDFLDKEGKLKKEFNEFTDSANKINTDLTDSFNDITNELKNLSNISKAEFTEARKILGMGDTDESTLDLPDFSIPGVKEKYDDLNEQLRAGKITQAQYDQEVKVLQQTPPPPSPPAETRPAPEPARPPAGVEPQTPAIPTKLPPLLTKTYPGQTYGAGRKGGRRHAGTDFEISGNEDFYSRIGGVVIYARDSGGAGGTGFGYGNVVDIYNKELGVTERIAEARTILVKEGQVVKPGQAVVRGEDLMPNGQPRTGVIHYEIRKGKAGASGSITGTMDPVKFLRDLGQTVNERYPKLSATDMNKYASLIESPGVEKDYRIAQMPQVIPFDIAMTNLNTKEVLPYGESTLAVVAANAVPELDDSEFKAQRELIMTALANIRQ